MYEVMNARDKKFYGILVLVWVLVNAVFWSWWFKEEHVASVAMYILMSVALLYETTVLPSFYLFFVGKMRRPGVINPPLDLKVAMITLCVPNKESIEVIGRQLKAMVAVSYSHDSWVLDEGNDVRVKALASSLGVKYFSRKGIGKYNQFGPPFQAKTKAGNVNAWIDIHGNAYDFFTQLDIDHNPHTDYLDKVLGQFLDSKVAWVQAPSVYRNLNEWTSRGSSEQELVLQGPLQMAFYGFCRTPFIIGSHTTYRMKAIREIGGFQPTRAEDHLDTVVLARHKYQGVFVPEVIAEGDGPESFDIYLAQQFAWAYSMIQVLFKYMPRYVLGYTGKQALQFLFAQTWYTFWSISMTILFILPCVALLTNTLIATMSFGEFIIRYLPVWGMTLVVWFWTKKWFQPKGISISWRGILLHIARWPVVLWALINVILGIKKPYMITAKGMNFGESRVFSLGTQIPYFALLILSFLSISLFHLRSDQGNVHGYLLFVLEGVILYTFLYSAVLLNDMLSMRAEKVKITRTLGLRFKHLVLMLGLWAAVIMTTIVSATPIAAAVTWVPLQTVGIPASLIVEKYVPVDEVSKVWPTPTLSPQTPMATATGTVVTPIVIVEQVPTALPSPKLLTNTLAFGAYDPDGTLKGLSLQIQHSFVVWFLPDDLTKAIESARKSQRFPLITLEPWPLLINNMTAETLLEDTNKGLYDEYIRKDAKAVKAQSPQEVLIRWGHEMELTGLYPWSQGNPNAYISAYLRVIDIFRKENVENVRWVWSPGGNLNAEDYYPGNAYVDYIGLTILADSRWDKEAGFTSVRSFETLLKEKYRLAEKYNKPLIAAEVGISTQDILEKNLWLTKARACFFRFPLLVGFVYFNATNTHSLSDGYRPSWNLDSHTFKEVLLD
jgi:cellulose synthase (UDP-forming)